MDRIVTQFELLCLFFTYMLTNSKHFLFILGKLDINRLSNATQSILAILESYFQKLHDNVQLLQIFISLTDIFEKIVLKKQQKLHLKRIEHFYWNIINYQ